MSFALTAASPAWASVGYELDASTPSRSLGQKAPHGIAVDQVSQRIYVAVVTTNPDTRSPGEVDRFNSDLTDAGTFGAGTGSYYSGIAVDPSTQGFYAAQALIHAPTGDLGQAKMERFSAAGALGTSFALSDTETLPQIATDSTGDVYFPNAATHSVQVFDSAGALQEEISCGGCTGGSFGEPVSVALNSDDELYVVDLAPDRVVKLEFTGGQYSFASVLQAGRGAAAVGVDPSSDDVFVGDLPGGVNYHIAAYDSTGSQFDDFGAGLFTDPPAEAAGLGAAQIAVNEATHEVYIGDAGKFYIFDRVTTQPPTAAIEPATPVRQISATLRAIANTKAHTALECEFEYVDDGDFQVNGFVDAASSPCSEMPVGAGGDAIDAKISGLSPATVYHYRVRLATYAGTVSSLEEEFETLPLVAPTVTTKSPVAVTQNGATLEGKVNPHGGSVSDCHFEYGTSVSYGKNLACSKLPEPVTVDVLESGSISGLVPGTTYHYRLVVSSNAGTAKGNDVEFTTVSPPSPSLPVTTTVPVTIAPPPSTTTPIIAARPLRCKKGFQKKRIRGRLKCVKRKRHARRHPAHR